MKHAIAIAQINPTVGDLMGNGLKIIKYIQRAENIGADIVIFPEQVVTGYPAQDLLLHTDFIKDTMYVNQQIAEHTGNITAIIGSVEYGDRGPNGNSLYNTALVMRNREIVARQAKTLLPTYDVFTEQRYFAPAPRNDPIMIDGIKYGIQICEDMWDEQYSRKITADLVNKGASAIVNISASPYYLHKKKVRYDLIRQHAREHHVPFIYVNMVGGQDELIFDGGSMIANPDGTISCQLPQFKESLSLIQPGKQALELLIKEEEIFHGLTLGLRDYFRKNKLSKAILGISGGIDSALTAAIATEALGPDNVKGIALPTQFNTSHAYEDALALAKNLGIDFDCVPLNDMYTACVNTLQHTFDGKPFDVTEENIQARLRMMVLMAYANKHGYTVLATGDKSEIALGYCTIYGDMSGAISVISDLTKPEVYAVARWYNHHKGREVIPLHTLTKPPSPELKPGQVAPFNYDRLSPLLEQITNRKSIAELQESGYSTDELRDMYRKWRSAEFKRWQAPIALKCKPTSFGKGRLYPVTNRYVPRALSQEI